jgi:hypothetical protein
MAKQRINGVTPNYDEPLPIEALEAPPEDSPAVTVPAAPPLGSGGSETSVTVITLPPLPAEPRGYAPAHLDGHLTPGQAAKLKRLTEALQAAEVQVTVGRDHRREIRTSIDTLRWLIDQIA